MNSPINQKIPKRFLPMATSDSVAFVSLQVRFGPKDGRPGRREHHKFGASSRKGTRGDQETRRRSGTNFWREEGAGGVLFSLKKHKRTRLFCVFSMVFACLFSFSFLRLVETTVSKGGACVRQSFQLSLCFVFGCLFACG